MLSLILKHIGGLQSFLMNLQLRYGKWLPSLFSSWICGLISVQRFKKPHPFFSVVNLNSYWPGVAVNTCCIQQVAIYFTSPPCAQPWSCVKIKLKKGGNFFPWQLSRPFKNLRQQFCCYKFTIFVPDFLQVCTFLHHICPEQL